MDFTSLQNRFADFDGPLHWRHDRSLSGYNTLNIGAGYESMMRWLGRGDRVMAMSKVHVPFRKGEDGYPVSISIPDHIDILYELANGAQVHMKMSANLRTERWQPDLDIRHRRHDSRRPPAQGLGWQTGRSGAPRGSQPSGGPGQVPG